METNLLVIKANRTLTKKQHDRLQELALDVGDELGMIGCVVDEGLDVEIHRDLSGVVEAFIGATETMEKMSQAVVNLVELNNRLLMAIADEEGVEDAPMKFLDEPA